jgi:hypothetical protein
MRRLTACSRHGPYRSQLPVPSRRVFALCHVMVSYACNVSLVSFFSLIYRSKYLRQRRSAVANYMREGRGEVAARVLTLVGAGLARVLSIASKTLKNTSTCPTDFHFPRPSPNALEPNPSRDASTSWTIQYGAEGRRSIVLSIQRAAGEA